MPGPQRDSEALQRFVRQCLIPGLRLERTQ
jgi:hypothetical protein